MENGVRVNVRNGGLKNKIVMKLELHCRPTSLATYFPLN
jgi:hypothetical protein